MDEIFAQLAVRNRLPIEAIRAADEDRAAMVPKFLRAFEQCATADFTTKRALLVAFHLLGQWREKRAYRPLAAFLRRPVEEVDPILGDAITVTAHRVMASVFDGDPTPLYDIILAPEADEFIRGRMCATLAMVTMRGELPRAEAERFLRSCDVGLQPREDCFVWDGWQSAIAMLGLVELKSMVKQAFDDGRIDPSWLEFEDFLKDLQDGVDGKPPQIAAHDEYELFGDTIEELKGWASFQPRQKKKNKPGRDAWSARHWSGGGTVRNPLRDIGRNDPCPCGSGKKFKKCCIDKPEEELRALFEPAESEEDFDEVDEDAFDETEFGAAEFDDTEGEALYDPLIAPEPDQWRAIDEQERIVAIRDFHRRAGIKTPNDEAHAIFHMIVENQIAEGDDLPVRRTAERLMAEGLDRHEAIHAIASVLAVYMNELIRDVGSGRAPNTPALPRPPKEAYFAELSRLTLKKWLRSA